MRDQGRERIGRLVTTVLLVFVMLWLFRGFTGAKPGGAAGKVEFPSLEDVINPRKDVVDLAYRAQEMGSRPEAAALQLKIALIYQYLLQDNPNAVRAYKQVFEQYRGCRFEAFAKFQEATLLAQAGPPGSDSWRQAKKYYEEVHGKGEKVELWQEARGRFSLMRGRDAYDLVITRLDPFYHGDLRYKALDTLATWFGNKNADYSFALALIVLSVVINLALLPLTLKQMHSAKEMAKLQPYMKEIQQRYKDDPKAVQAEMMALYKRHGVNPLGGCLPMVLQMAIIIPIYGGVRIYQYPLLNAHFLWVKSLAHPDWILLVIYAVTMLLTTRLFSPRDPTNPSSQWFTYLFPVLMLWVLRTLPSGFVLYWMSQNIVLLAPRVFASKRAEEAPLRPKVKMEPARADERQTFALKSLRLTDAILAQMGVSAVSNVVEDSPRRVVIRLSGPDAVLFAANRNKALNALQTLVRAISDKQGKQIPIIISLDESAE